MSTFDRADTSLLGRWWWTVDRWTLVAVTLLMGFGAVLVLAASPAAGGRIGAEGFLLAKRQLIVLPLAFLAMLAISIMDARQLRRLAVIGAFGALLLVALTLVAGTEIKGASRWLSLAGFSLQPSEFLKPFLAVTLAWLFAAERKSGNGAGLIMAIALGAVSVGLLLLQPDLGQALLVTAIWGTQFLLAGFPLVWVGLLSAVGLSVLVGAYLLLPHVTERIHAFLDPASGDRYQIERALEAFSGGGLFGVGPGEGRVKALLPDSHSDFILAVAGEEFGIVVCMMIVALFLFIVLRGLVRVYPERSLFSLLSVSGLLTLFGLQALINMASTLNLIPTKGMTLPFISYGGSSLLASGLAMGLVLAFTRRGNVGGDL